MKFILGIVISAVLFLNCKNTTDATSNLQVMEIDKQELINKESAIDSVIYIATTRGFYEKIIISKSSMKLTNDRSEARFLEMKLDEGKWELLVSAVNEVGTLNINKYSAPSEKHQVDGAALANLSVYKDGKEFKSQRFDHKYPPKQLSNITDIIYNLTEQISKQ